MVHTFHSLTPPSPPTRRGAHCTHTGNDAERVSEAEASNSCQKLLQWSPSRSRAPAPPTCLWRPRCASASKQHPEQLAPQSWMRPGGAPPPAPQVHATPCSLPPPFSSHRLYAACTTINTITGISNHSQKHKGGTYFPRTAPSPASTKTTRQLIPCHSSTFLVSLFWSKELDYLFNMLEDF